MTNNDLLISHGMLEAVEIPVDDDLDIRCGDGLILIASAELEPHPLMQLVDHFSGKRTAVRYILEGGSLDDE